MIVALRLIDNWTGVYVHNARYQEPPVATPALGFTNDL